MNSKIPYLIDAIRFWSMDSGLTPQLLINADTPGISLPFDQIETSDGEVAEVILNVHEQAVNAYRYEEDHVVFQTRFTGRSYEVSIPLNAVIAVFTRETQEGLHLQAISHAESEIIEKEGNDAGESVGKSPPPLGKPHLTLVK